MNDDRLPWLGLVLIAPIIALFLIAAQSLGAIAQSSARVGSAEIAAELAARAAVVMDDLQSERSNTAALRLSSALLSAQQYRDRMASTDRTIANFFDLAEDPMSGVGPDASAQLLESLSGLAEARRLGMDTEVTLDVAVTAYTEVLKGFMDTLALEFARTHAAERDFTTAFVMLARLHERVAIETSVGLNAFYSGAMDPASHRVLIEAIAPQEALMQAFEDLTDDHWTLGLEEVLARVDAGRLQDAREALIAAGYGAPLDRSHREFWREERLPVYFDLGVFRNRFAQEGISQVLQDAQTRNDEAVRGAGLQILILLLASGAAMLGFARLTPARRREGEAAGLVPAE